MPDSVVPFNPSDVQVVGGGTVNPVIPTQSSYGGTGGYGGYGSTTGYSGYGGSSSYGSSGYGNSYGSSYSQYNQKPGWQTSEFWLAATTVLISGLFTAGVINHELKSNLESSLPAMVPNVVVIGGSLFSVVKYIVSRKQVKSDAIQAHKEIVIAKLNSDSSDDSSDVASYLSNKYGMDV